MSSSDLADEVWRTIASLVHDNRDGWKRAVVEQTGLPFSRIRILKRLSRQPMTVKQLAHAATMDAPAATVAVHDPAPDVLAALDDDELKELKAIIDKLAK